MLRVSGGIDKGKRVAPVHATVRPIMERVRTAFFARIEHFISINGITVLDLFGGSGIIGLEALSRGAQSITTCEKNRAVFRCIGQCYRNYPVDRGYYRLYHTSAERFVDSNQAPFNLIIIDPPYTYQHYENLLVRAYRSLSTTHSVIAVFHRADRTLHTVYPVLTANRYGDTAVTLLDGTATTSASVAIDAEPPVDRKHGENNGSLTGQ